jgi:hypothetical protein
MTIPRYEQLASRWRTAPPTNVLLRIIASSPFIGLKLDESPRPSASSDNAAAMAELMQLFPDGTIN